MQDWSFNRQRYWGEPFPVVFCEKCGTVSLPDADLPLKLPKTNDYMPNESGNSPLSKINEWVNCKCPNCGGNAKRETDTMPNWAGSSWYWLRYCDPHNEDVLADFEKLKYWEVLIAIQVELNILQDTFYMHSSGKTFYMKLERFLQEIHS